MPQDEKQRTIKKEARFSGISLQTGKKVTLRCLPAGEGKGVVFRRVDLEGAPEVPLSPRHLSSSRLRRSALKKGRAEVETTEHFLAALWALGVDNLVAEIDAPELPAMDGSAAEFIAGLEKAGVDEQSAARRVLELKRPHVVRVKGASISAYPADKFSVSYEIDYPVGSIGKEKALFDLDGGIFSREIAPARTFCMKKEAVLLLKMGLGKGASLQNTLVMDEDGPMGTALRFSNEPLRHKVLDLVGDLYTLGVPLRARIEAVKSGHRLNSELVRQLYREYIMKDEENGTMEKGRGIFSVPPFSFLRAKKKGEIDGR